MPDGLIGLATAGCQALAAIAKEIPAIRKLLRSKDERIRATARTLQSEIVAYCNELEGRVKEARAALNHDPKLLAAKLSVVDKEWAQRMGRWKTFFQSAPSKRIKAMLVELDGFGDRLTALLMCQDENESLWERASVNGDKTVSYAKLIAADPPIGEILDRIERDANGMRHEAGSLGTL